MDCKPGFYGSSCNKTCLPGFYGDLCGGACHPTCTIEECDPVHGCILTTTKLTRPTNSEKSVLLVTEDALPQRENISYNILLGMSGVVCLFILVILLKYYKKIYSKKRHNMNQRSQEQDLFHNGNNYQRQEGIQRSRDTISELVGTGPVCNLLETEYDEINETCHARCVTFTEPLNVYDKAKYPL